MGTAVDAVRPRPEDVDVHDGLAAHLPALREALERERAFRREQLAAMSGAGIGAGRGTGAEPAADARAEVEALVVAAARLALSDIEHALAAMRSGRYGRCAGCGAAIPLEMLRAVPQARWCLDCHLARSAEPGTPARRGRAVPGTARRNRSGPEADGTDRPARAEHDGPAPPHPVLHPVPRPGEEDTGRARSVVWVRQLRGRPVTGPQQQHLGHVRDVLVERLAESGPTVMTALAVDVGGHEVAVPASAVVDLRAARVALNELPGPGRPSRPGEFALVRGTMRQPVLDATGARVRIGDIALRRTAAGWVVWAVDLRSAVERLRGARRRIVAWDEIANRRLAASPRAARPGRRGGSGSTP